MKENTPTLSDITRRWKAALPKTGERTGIIVLMIVLLILSALVELRSTSGGPVLMAGEVSSQDIIASRDLWIEDTKATEAQRKAIAELSPAVFDLSPEPIRLLRDTIMRVLTRIASSPEDLPAEELAKELNEEIGVPIEPISVLALGRQDVRDFITSIGLPWLTEQLAAGVIADSRELRTKGGVLVRNPRADEETLRRDPEYIVDLPILLTQSSRLMFNQSKIPPSVRHAVDKFLALVIKPTLIFNREATFEIGESMSRSVKPIFYNVHKGDIIVYKGERVTPEAQLKLQALYSETAGLLPPRPIIGTFMLSLLISLGLLFTPGGSENPPLQNKDYIVIGLFLLVMGLLGKSAYLLGERLLDPRILGVLPYGFPVAGFAGLFALIFGARRYWVLGLLLSIFPALLFKEGLPVFMCYFFSAILNIDMTLRSQTRQDIVRSTIPLFFSLLAISLSCSLMQDIWDWESYLWVAVVVAINAILSVFILFAVSPLLETGLHYSTRFRLMELMNMEQPLLQELMVTIPGTYHHSLVVSNMVEAGAKAIGANSLLCKVAALYHDVGKLARPEYFIENQMDGPNKHDHLAPTMSALILASHVKKGTELSRKFHLGDEVTNIIQQHHGTSSMRFFYNKAKELGENPKIEDYSYPGPKPQSREAAIVMLADVVEASSRTLDTPTPARLTAHVNTIMKNIFADGQLDESDLTFKELNKLSESFVRVLTGIFHHRIAYPDRQRKAVSLAANGAAPTAQNNLPSPTETPAGDVGSRTAG